MTSKSVLELTDLKRIATGAEAEAFANNWAVTIAIVDDGGHLLWLQRLDGAPPLTTHIAPAKARTAAMGRRDSKVYEEMINKGRVSFFFTHTHNHQDKTTDFPHFRPGRSWENAERLAAQ
jgi:glc operon protein GlcG